MTETVTTSSPGSIRQHVADYVALDGGRVSVTSPVALGPTSTNATAQLRSVGASSVGLSAGNIGFAESLAYSPEIAVGMRFDEEFAFQGGSLRLGAGGQPVGPDGDYWERGRDGKLRPEPIRMAIWTGRNFEVHIVRYDGEADQLLEIFRQFIINEMPWGVTCTPREPAKDYFIEGPSVTMDIPQLAIVLEIAQLTKQTARSLPKHRGTKVRGGELYSGKVGDSEDYFLLAAGTAKCTFVSYGEVATDRLAATLSELVVSWQ